MQQNGPMPQDLPQPFAMDQLRRDLDAYQTPPQNETAPWAPHFNSSERGRMEAAFRSPGAIGGKRIQESSAPVQRDTYNSFKQDYQTFKEGQVQRDSHQRPLGMNGFQGAIGMGYGMNMGMMSPQYRMNLASRPGPDQQIEGKGKGRMVELDEKDWEKQFAALENVETDQRDLDEEANRAMEEDLNEMDRSVNRETDELGDFESIWRGIEAETRATVLDRNLHGDQAGMHMGEDSILWNLDKDMKDFEGFDSHFHDAFRDPQLGNYLFEQDNPFSGTANPFDEGLKIMRDGGNLSLAALAFEAAVQQDANHIEAWYQLGSAQAQNEKEAPAIRALEQSLKLDPTNLPALMGLAISYTNEGYDSTAYRTLERWLATKYPQIVCPDDLTADADYGFTDRQLLREKVTDLFIKAAQLSPDGEHMDPDVQVGLGVLFYGAEEYAKAVDCFEAALASTEEGVSNEPQQAHLLWNRLGATLANSGRSEDAIGAYEQALTLKPNFVRARYNLGVSCINIGVYEQAVQHLLSALSMHNVVEREGIDRVREVVGEGRDVEEVERMVGMNQSTNLIETLRRVFGSMGRRDLAERVERGMDVEAFRGEFDF